MNSPWVGSSKTDYPESKQCKDTVHTKAKNMAKTLNHMRYPHKFIRTYFKLYCGPNHLWTVYIIYPAIVVTDTSRFLVFY